MKKFLQPRMWAVYLSMLLLLSVCFVLPALAADTALPAAQLHLSESDGILTLSLQLQGTALTRTQCIALSYDTDVLSLLRKDGTSVPPTDTVTAYDAREYVITADGWSTGIINTVSGKRIPMLEHGTAGTDRGLLLLYPTASVPQTYDTPKTVLTLHFGRVGEAPLQASSIRLFSYEEQTAASQSVKLMLCTADDYYTYGSHGGGDVLSAPVFVGHPIISGAMENDTADPSTSWVNPFIDITDDLLYYDAIVYVAKNGLFVGNENSEFQPDESMNRATFATVLCRLAGDEKTVLSSELTESVFTDVPITGWAAPYITWASEQNMILGYGNGSFGPDDPITHEQMYLIIQRFLQTYGYAVKDGTGSSLSALTDAADISSWAIEAVKFAQENGLLIADANRSIRPTEPASRWELAVLLQSLSEIPRTASETASLTDALNTASVTLTSSASDTLVRGAIETVYNGLLAVSEKINVAAFRLTREQLGLVYLEAAKRPELFYVDNVFHYSYNMDSGEILTITPVYTMRGTALSSALKQYNDGLNALLSEVDQNLSDFEKVLYLHDLLGQRYVYDESLGNFDTLTLMQTGRGVCQAYTLLMGALLDAVGIENDRVTSEAMNHTWNLVCLDGKWYHIDVTWDDPRPDQLGQVQHLYFLKSDAYMLAHDHYDWSSFENRTCTDTTYDNSFFNDVRTPFVAGENGLWYYINNNSGAILCWNTETNARTRIYNTNIRWATAEGVYSNKFSGLIRIGNLLLYNSADAICSYNLDTKTAETVHKTTAAGYICGLTLTWKTDSAAGSIPYLVYQVRSAPGDSASQQYQVSIENLLTYSVRGTVRGYFADAVTKITLTRNGTTYKTLTLPRTNVFTEAEQTFAIDSIKPGRYDLTVEKKGCFSYTVKNIDIMQNIDLTQSPGSLNLLCGDINSDGKIDDTDRTLLLHEKTFRQTRELSQNASADLNGDGIIDIVDCAILTDADRFGKDKTMCIVTHAA